MIGANSGERRFRCDVIGRVVNRGILVGGVSDEKVMGGSRLRAMIAGRSTGS